MSAETERKAAKCMQSQASENDMYTRMILTYISIVSNIMNNTNLDRWDEWHPLRNALPFWVTLIGNGTWNVNFKFSAVAEAIFSPNS